MSNVFDRGTHPSREAAAKKIRDHTQGATRKVKGWLYIYHPRTWKEKGLLWTAGVLLSTYVVIVLALAVYWSRTPGIFDVRKNAESMADNPNELVTGSYTTAAAIRIGETLLDKPGGYLSNDVMPPGVFLDNIPSWEYGALMALRDLAETMRNEFSRSQSQSVADKSLQVAHPVFNFDSESWILPSTESQYRKGISALKDYFRRLSDEDRTDAQFYARADNLASYLDKVSKRLGDLANRLAFAVGAPRYNTARVGEPGARQSTPQPEVTYKKTPWLEIDDIFFEARGYTWTLLEVLRAAKIDFESVLTNKTATVSLDQVIDPLEDTQAAIYSPLILNGKGFGIFANHSLVMASYISRANAGIINLHDLLERG
jgi:hypothetical protein